MENLAADLGRFAATQPDAVLYSFLDGAGRIVESYTYRGFDERTNFVAAALLHSGRVAPGDRVLLVYTPGLERDPLGELRRVYDTLGLPGFAQAEPPIRAYVDSQRTYEKNRLKLSAQDRREVTEQWAFAFRAFGYPSDAAADADAARGVTGGRVRPGPTS